MLQHRNVPKPGNCSHLKNHISSPYFSNLVSIIKTEYAWNCYWLQSFRWMNVVCLGKLQRKYKWMLIFIIQQVIKSRSGLSTLKLQVFINKRKTNLFCSNKINFFHVHSWHWAQGHLYLYVGSMSSIELGHVTQRQTEHSFLIHTMHKNCLIRYLAGYGTFRDNYKFSTFSVPVSWTF